jgi:hypothetical protein
MERPGVPWRVSIPRSDGGFGWPTSSRATRAGTTVRRNRIVPSFLRALEVQHSGNPVVREARSPMARPRHPPPHEKNANFVATTSLPPPRASLHKRSFTVNFTRAPVLEKVFILPNQAIKPRLTFGVEFPTTKTRSWSFYQSLDHY